MEDEVLREIRQAVGTLIRAERRDRDYTVERVARRLGISRVALTQIESGKSNVNAVQLWILAGTLGCSTVQDFFPKITPELSLSRITKADMEKLRKKDERAPQWAASFLRDELEKHET